jgi:hypothetical protein
MLPVREPVISRHRLKQPYRAALAALWLLPPGLLVSLHVLVGGHTILDLRLALPVFLLALPAWYIWREGVDVTPGGFITRIHMPKRWRFDAVGRWIYDAKTGVLRVWDHGGQVAVECRASHMTEFQRLLETLEARVRANADARSSD